jgi:DNA primase
MCFRYQARGDVIGFIQQIEHLSFREVVERPGGSRPGQRHTGRRPPPRTARSQRLRLTRRPEDLDVLNTAIELYRNRLLVGGKALQYLSSRGIARETIEQAQLGLLSATS